jgi:hypothetical protein
VQCDAQSELVRRILDPRDAGGQFACLNASAEAMPGANRPMGLVFVMWLIGLGTLGLFLAAFFSALDAWRQRRRYARSKAASVGTFFIGTHECLRGNGPGAGLVCAGTAPLVRPAFQQASVSERNATYPREKNR